MSIRQVDRISATLCCLTLRSRTVCGESCAQQICPKCASDDQLEQVVDQILFQTLADVRASDDGDLRLITLRCGHIFTLETLDGICGLQHHYIQDQSGKWLRLKDYHPPDGLATIPRCPNCRSDIDSPRYSRVVKRAKLDLMENNVASQLSHSMAIAQGAVSSVDLAEAKLEVKKHAVKIFQAPLSTAVQPKSLNRRKRKAFSYDREQPISLAELLALSQLHENSASEWKRITAKLIRAYEEVSAVAAKRSAHRTAYEAAFVRLYKKELNAAFAFSISSPETRAMKITKMKMGQPKPLADLRYKVEVRSINDRR